MASVRKAAITSSAGVKKGRPGDAITISKLQEHEPIEEGPHDEVNKTAEEVAAGFLETGGNRGQDGLSDNLQPFKSNLSDNLHVGNDEVDDLSPRFTKEDGIKNDDEENASISLTQYYLKGSVQERKAAPNDKDEFLKTLNQMENEDVPAQVIDEYKKSEILRKSMAVVKKHA